MFEEHEQTRAREAAVEAEKAGKPRLVLRGGTSEEEVDAFRSAARVENERIAETVAQQVEEQLTPREQLFIDLLWQFWDDATWMATGDGFLGFFPDGRPKTEQHPWHRVIWGIFISAIVRRANGPQESRGDNDERETNGT